MSAKNDIIHNDFLSGEEADFSPSDTNINNRKTMMAKKEEKKGKEEKQPNQQTDSISVTSFFCGCGGLDLGFRGGFDYKGQNFPRTDFSILKAYDNNPLAIKTYKANVGEEAEVAENRKSPRRSIATAAGSQDSRGFKRD